MKKIAVLCLFGVLFFLHGESFAKQKYSMGLLDPDDALNIWPDPYLRRIHPWYSYHPRQRYRHRGYDNVYITVSRNRYDCYRDDDVRAWERDSYYGVVPYYWLPLQRRWDEDQQKEWEHSEKERLYQERLDRISIPEKE